ncbi:hypothetical protein HRR78_002122 [Exophiala dermatitidis]|nr:hypothetical protein HRR78_002122 [Exophiala dermatitidis]
MATYWLSVILAFCAFFNQISAKDANLCDEYSHPKLDCKYGLQCQSNWEWATGNYDGMVVVNKRMATLDAVSLVVKMFGDADNLTSENTQRNDHHYGSRNYNGC